MAHRAVVEPVHKLTGTEEVAITAASAVAGDPGFGAVARFAGPGELLAAVKRLRAAGYRRLDTYSPSPTHGMERALRLR
jgi:hypothetical protein